MHPSTDLVDRYFAIWNERNPQTRRALIAQTWTDDATYVDPLMRAEGRDQIDTLIAGVQAQFPGFRFRRATEVDAHNNCARFGWELGPDDGPAVAGGVDFAVIVGERLQSVTGFLDFAPAPAE